MTNTHHRMFTKNQSCTESILENRLFIANMAYTPSPLCLVCIGFYELYVIPVQTVLSRGDLMSIPTSITTMTLSHGLHCCGDVLCVCIFTVTLSSERPKDLHLCG